MKRTLLTVLGLALLLIVAGVLIWRRSSDPLSEGLALLISPRAATAADWKNVVVEKHALDTAGNSVPWGIACKLLPVLEADTNSVAHHACITNERTQAGGIRTTFWSPKFENTLIIDYDGGNVEKAPGKRVPGGLTPEEQSPDEKTSRNSPRIGFGYDDQRKGAPCISLSTPVDSPRGGKRYFAVAYDHSGFAATGLFASRTYPIAIMAKMFAPPKMGVASIMVFDIFKGTLVNEIQVPEAARNTRPIYTLDRENDVINAVAYDVDWVMAIDCRPYIKKEHGGKAFK